MERRRVAVNLEVQESSTVLVLRYSGRLFQGDGADDLLKAGTSQHKQYVFVDLGGVTSIDAAGVGALAELERRARQQGWVFHLLNPSECVTAALETTDR